MKNTMKKPDSEQNRTELSQELVVGIIRGTHGLSGTMKIESTSGEIEHFFELEEVRVKKGSFDKVFKIEEVFGDSPLLLKLSGIESQEEAQRLSGCEILVPRDKACPLDEDEFYIEDLKNASLVYYPTVDKVKSIGKTKSNEEITKDASMDLKKIQPRIVGYITDVVEGGSGQLLEVALTESVNPSEHTTNAGQTQKTVFVPFRKEFIGTVDIARKEVQLMHLWILE